MTEDEIAVMDGGKCILQLRGVRPFFSDKFDITGTPEIQVPVRHWTRKNPSLTWKSTLNRPAIVQARRGFDYYELDAQTYRRTQTMRKRSAEEKTKQLERF